MNYYIYNTRNS